MCDQWVEVSMLRCVVAKEVWLCCGLASYFLQIWIPGEIRHPWTNVPWALDVLVMAALMVGKLAQCNDYFNNNKATIIDDD